MQYNVATPSEYLERLEEDWRKEKLRQVRQLIKANGPELEEGIEYKMLSYGRDGKTIFHLNAQKAYVSLYVGNLSKLENAQALLSDFDQGKGCIRIKKTIDLAETHLEEFIQKTIARWKAGEDTDC